MNELCVLITNYSLTAPGGSEMYVYDLATRLLERGHQPVVYSQRLGMIAERLLNATIPVIDDLNQLGRIPDIMHCHPSLASAAALLRFPETPAVYVCHDWAWHHDTPPRIKRIRQLIAVDSTIAERLTNREGRKPEEVIVVRNGVDLRRFRLRAELPTTPKRALVFSNYMTSEHVDIVRRACAEHGIEVDAMGSAVGHTHAHPERLLGEYDLVFGKGRCAWEALSCGAAVVVCDVRGVGEMISTENLSKAISRNFGRRLLRKPLQIETISAQIARFNRSDAAQVSLLVREQADLDRTVDRLVEIYRKAIAEQDRSRSHDLREELRELSRLIAYCDRSKDLWQSRFDSRNSDSSERSIDERANDAHRLRIRRDAA